MSTVLRSRRRTSWRRTALGCLSVLSLSAALSISPAAADPGPGYLPPSFTPTPQALAAKTSTSAPSGMAPTNSNLVYHNGTVQTVPRVCIGFWGFSAPLTAEQSSYESRLTNFVSGMGNNPWTDLDAQYSQVVGGTRTYINNATTNRLVAAWTDTTAAPAVPSGANVAAAAQRLSGHCGAVSANTQYLVALGPGHHETGFGTTFCAYHSRTTTAPAIVYISLPYSLDVNNCGEQYAHFAGVSILSGHEIAESETDPAFDGWYGAGGGDDENADKCIWNRTGVDAAVRAFATGSFWVQPNWSNKVTGCTHSDVPGTAGVTNSGSAGGTLGTHTASASCSLDGVTNAMSPYSGSYSGSTTRDGGAVPATGAHVRCDVSNTDPNSSGSFALVGDGGVNGKVTAAGTYNTGARRFNRLCVSGSISYGDGTTVSIAQKCVTF